MQVEIDDAFVHPLIRGVLVRGCLLSVGWYTWLEVLDRRGYRLLLTRAVALHGCNFFYLRLWVQALPLLGAATALPMRALMATMAIRGALTLLLLILGERMSTSGV